MMEFGSLFLGGISRPIRSYLYDVFVSLRKSKRYTRMVIPSVGQFGVARVAVKAGWPCDSIWCSDVSLFSTVIASYVNECETPTVKPLDDVPYDLTDAPSLLFYQKLLAVENEAKHYHQVHFPEEMRRNAEDFISEIQAQLDLLRKQLKGIHYEGLDLFDHVEKEIDDLGVICVLSPPSYKGGYEKMFDTGGRLIWSDQPKYTVFDPKVDYKRIYERMLDGSALGLLLLYDVLMEECWGNVLCAEKTSWGKKAGRLFTNRPGEVARLVPKRVLAGRAGSFGPCEIPVLSYDYVITTESKLGMVLVGSSVAMYYRDLFAHGLGVCSGNAHYLFVVDGFIAGVVGFGSLFDMNFREQDDGKRYVTEMFAFTTGSHHQRLNRLLKSAILCKESQQRLNHPEKLRWFDGVSSTCISKFPEFKPHRGIFKLVKREVMKDGRYKLHYRNVWSGKSYQGVLVEWVRKHARS